ncbi:MAG: tetratricopeptide repeat protein [Chitinophagales bacterium]|nr:tetratricopeptide repeat protein [Chitinophagales bacterium]
MRIFCMGLLFCYSTLLFAQSVTEAQKLITSAENQLNAKPRKSLEEAEKALAAFKAEKNTSGTAKSLAILAVAYYKVDQYDKALKHINESIKLSRQIADTSIWAYATYWKGNVELHNGNYPHALDLYQECYNLSEAAGDNENLTRALDGKASIYEALNEVQKAEEYYKEALKVAEKSGFSEWIPTILFSLASIEHQKGNTDAAIGKFLEAIKLSEEINNLNNKANCLQQLAYIAYEKDELKKAMQYIQQGMDIFKQTGSLSSYSYSQLLMSAILLKEKDWDLAIALATQSLDEGKSKKETGLQRDAAEILYYAYLGKRNTARALDYHVMFHQLSEKKHNEELAKKLTQLELQSNFEKERQLADAEQAKEKAEMNVQIQQQRLMQKAAVVGFLFIGVIAGVAIFAFMQKRKDTKLIAAEKQKSDMVLAGLLPDELFREVKGAKSSNDYTEHTVMFVDVKSFAKGDSGTAQEARTWFNETFRSLLEKHGLQKIETDGDTYLAISKNGVAEKYMAQNTIRAGIELLESVKQRNAEKASAVEIGVGIHTGLVIAGVVGLKTATHEVWGDTVNEAARIEQHGMHGKVNISSETQALVQDDFKCVNYGNLPSQNGVELGMYFVDIS